MSDEDFEYEGGDISHYDQQSDDQSEDELDSSAARKGKLIFYGTCIVVAVLALAFVYALVSSRISDRPKQAQKQPLQPSIGQTRIGSTPQPSLQAPSIEETKRQPTQLVVPSINSTTTQPQESKALFEPNPPWAKSVITQDGSLAPSKEQNKSAEIPSVHAETIADAFLNTTADKQSIEGQIAPLLEKLSKDVKALMRENRRLKISVDNLTDKLKAFEGETLVTSAVKTTKSLPTQTVSSKEIVKPEFIFDWEIKGTSGQYAWIEALGHTDQPMKVGVGQYVEGFGEVVEIGRGRDGVFRVVSADGREIRVQRK